MTFIPPKLLEFSKRYFILILCIVLIGNVVVFLNTKEKKAYYEYSIKAKVRNDFYDPTRTLFEQIVQGSKDDRMNILNLTADERHLLSDIGITSYRNEDIYYVELTLFFSDTALAHNIISKVEQYIVTSPYLKQKYFDRIKNIDQLVDRIERAAITDTNKVASTGVLTIEAQRIGLLFNKDNLQRQFEILSPYPSQFKLASTGGSGRLYIVATILALTLGLFISIVIDQLQPKAA